MTAAEAPTLSMMPNAGSTYAAASDRSSSGVISAGSFARSGILPFFLKYRILSSDTEVLRVEGSSDMRISIQKGT